MLVICAMQWIAIAYRNMVYITKKGKYMYLIAFKLYNRKYCIKKG